jgi:hypothetical protein
MTLRFRILATVVLTSFSVTSAVAQRRHPVAKIVAPATASPNTSVTLDGSQSLDPDGSIVEYKWRVQKPDGRFDTFSGSPQPVIPYSWDAAGLYRVTLTVTGTDGETATTEASVTVGADSPYCTVGTVLPKVLLPEASSPIPTPKPLQITYLPLLLDFTQLGASPGVLCAATSTNVATPLQATLKLVDTGEVFPMAQTIATATITMYDKNALTGLTTCAVGGKTNDCLLGGLAFDASHNYASYATSGFDTTILGQTASFGTGVFKFWVDLNATGISASTPFEPILRQLEAFFHVTLLNNLAFVSTYTIIQDPGLVQLLVVDDAGSAIGYLPNGSFRNDMLFSFYATSNLTPTIIIFGPRNSGFQVTVTGVAAGPYSVIAAQIGQGALGAAQGSLGALSVSQSAVFQFNPKLTTLKTLTPVVQGDVNGDGKIDTADLAIITANLGLKTKSVGVDPRADVNLDGVVDALDSAVVSKVLPAVTAAKAGPKDVTVVTRQFQLDGTGSTSFDGKPLTYKWSIPPGSPGAGLLGGETATPTVQFSIARGPYTFQLTVTDSTGKTSTDTVTINFAGW